MIDVVVACLHSFMNDIEYPALLQPLQAERVKANAAHRLAETTFVHRIFGGYLRSQVILPSARRINVLAPQRSASDRRPSLSIPFAPAQLPSPTRQVKCTSCGFCSNTYEPFLDLSLEIQGRVASLEEALARFTAVETLDKANRCAGRCCAVSTEA